MPTQKRPPKKRAKARPTATRSKAKKPSRPRAAARPKPRKGGELVELDAMTFPVELNPSALDEGLRKMKDQLMDWAKKGRYTRVRLKFRGKALLPDLPLAAFVAAEGLTFYWGGILRALLMNVAGRSVFDVELVNDSDGRVEAGKRELLAGELENALGFFAEALDMDRANPRAHLHLGVALKLKGDKTGAVMALRRARDLDPRGQVGAEAVRMLAGLQPPEDPGSTALATVKSE
jgi:hypothetical protein